MKIAVTGPESSGKSSLSTALSHHFDAQYFSEYAREYLMERAGEYSFEDIAKIAALQEEIRTNTARKGLKIYDTEAIVLYIWSVYKYQQCDPSIVTLLDKQDFDCYFLCSPNGVPWEDDPLREHPNEREKLFELYEEQLQKMNVNYFILEGSFDERLQQAIAIVEELMLSKGGHCF